VTGGDAGFTGTRQGPSALQRENMLKWLSMLQPRSLHYGDCRGADYEAWQYCKFLGVWTVCHPPVDPKDRMFTVADDIREPKPYLERNRDIVDESGYLVACPLENREIIRSGTWSTIRYAWNISRPVVLLYPDGRVDSPSGWSVP
jgi:hypothetical protein